MGALERRLCPPEGLPCPNCATRLVACEHTEVGRVTLCLQCRGMIVLDFEVNEFDPLGQYPVLILRRPSDTEETHALADPAVQSSIAALARYHADFGPPMDHPADGQGQD